MLCPIQSQDTASKQKNLFQSGSAQTSYPPAVPLSAAMATFNTASTPNPNPNKSVEVVQPPSDSVSSLTFSPNANFLVATSWDNQWGGGDGERSDGGGDDCGGNGVAVVWLWWLSCGDDSNDNMMAEVRCWEIMRNGATVGSVPKASMSHDLPVLCSTWKDDGTTVFSGGCDKQVKMWPLLSGGQPMTVAMHDAPISEIAWIPEMNLLVSGSWDKTLRYWDLRQSNPVHTQQLPDRCYAFAVRHPLMVVAIADRNIIVFNLQNPQQFLNDQSLQ
ncbi:hypothetical protein TEA_027101 [Camellia sinensis var. sinensis]|uniref:Uncharacterized protein n=1 Tax=Camellia sinensis var. sinensis TaxID=542762 RepID=A0A4S4DZ46_CAMSN|nr:hypothetical protein TEA_027101 [Camellia sinensis var. sinensis]